MAVKVKEEVELSDVKARHLKRVERRAKYLATLTPQQRRIWDDHVAYIRWWRREYDNLSTVLHRNKMFIRTPAGHNSLATYKSTMKSIHQQKLKARTMMLARLSASVQFIIKMEGK